MSSKVLRKMRSSKEFKACNVYSKEECKKCFARFYCSGDAAQRKLLYDQWNLWRSDGKLEYAGISVVKSKRVECALMVKAALALEEETENEEAYCINGKRQH